MTATEINRRAFQERLFELLSVMRSAGATPARVGDVDDRVDRGEGGLFLKHDIHALDLQGLESFAARQASLGLLGTYLFMAPEHPLTAPRYGFKAQVRTMKAIGDLGHEIGLHIDPYFLMHHMQCSLASVMTEVLRRFRHEGVTFTVGNMHGNSKHKHPDLDGRGTMFDLFDELGRQPDYPALTQVPAGSAELIRANRVSIRAFGFERWADMPMWSARHGFVVTHFLTDNQLGKMGTIEALVHEEALGAYKLCDRQPPGSRTREPARAIVPIRSVASSSSRAAPRAEPRAEPRPELGSEVLPFASAALYERMKAMAPHPTLFLIHPEFYC